MRIKYSTLQQAINAYNAGERIHIDQYKFYPTLWKTLFPYVVKVPIKLDPQICIFFRDIG